MSQNTTANEEPAEVGATNNVKNLYERLAKFRKKLKSSEGSEKNSKLFLIAAATGVFSIINTVFLLLFAYALKLFTPYLLQTVGTTIRICFGFLLLAMIFSMLTFLVDIVFKMVRILRRSEDDRAGETYQETFLYVDEGKKSLKNSI